MLFFAIFVASCANTYGNLVSGSNLGAQEYQPAVLIKDGKKDEYMSVLTVCRQAATNRQITAAQEAQLHTITGVSSGAMEGAASGMQLGSIFKQAGMDTSINQSMGIGMLSGALSSLGSSFASGTDDAASETKKILLGCLRRADPNQKIYSVLE